jgi:hypothetical protein
MKGEPGAQYSGQTICQQQDNMMVRRTTTFKELLCRRELTFAALRAWTFLAKNQQHFLAVFSQTLNVAAN